MKLKCDNNICGYCRLFSRRENCSNCSEFRNALKEKEENEKEEKKKEEENNEK